MAFLENTNDSNLNTSYSTLERPASKGVDYSDYVSRLMTVIENATEARHHKDLLMHYLTEFETLIRFDVPLNVRPDLFRKLNNLLSHMSLTHTDDNTLCMVFLNLITILRNQINSKEQSKSETNEQEWEELQRSVFLITNWEDNIEYGVKS